MTLIYHMTVKEEDTELPMDRRDTKYFKSLTTSAGVKQTIRKQ